MRNNKKFIVAMACIMAMGLTACGCGNDNTANDIQQVEPNYFTENTEQGDSDIETQKEEAQDLESNVTDNELEENLALYRAKREDWTDTPLGNGVTGSGGKAQNPEDFNLYFDTSAMDNFDAREVVDAYDVAKNYVENVLGVTVTTKHTVYMCVDPRIWEIYESENKGVAEGYEAKNIFVCEYCDNGNWKYLILVRKGKGSAWEVIHNGSSYMEG